MNRIQPLLLVILSLCVWGNLAAKPCPHIKVQKSAQKTDYPGVFGAPIHQAVYVWVSAQCLPKQLKKGGWQNALELDSFYWRGYRGLGTHGKNGAEVKSLFSAGAYTAINKGVYQDRLLADSIAQGNWLLIYGYLSLYPNNVDDISRIVDDLPHAPVQVPYKDGDPELQIFYHWNAAMMEKKKACFCRRKCVQSGVIKIQKIEKSASVMHP